jgi:nucleotide-binding universal stress UspA family protein
MSALTPHGGMKVLLAVDGSDYTKRMLAYLATHPELLGTDGSFTALTVVPDVPPRARAYLEGSMLEDYYRSEATHVLDPVRHFAAQKGWRLDAQYRVGHAGDVIAEMADSGRYDLVVMGSHGYSALGGAVLGSVATRVLARCRTPVLILH